MNPRKSIYDVKSFYKKGAVHKASFQGMRYLIRINDEKLEACTWPEPFSFEKTDDDKKTYEYFEVTEEGLDKAYEWLCESWEGKEWPGKN